MANAYLDNGRLSAKAARQDQKGAVSSHFLLDNYASVSSSQAVATLVRVPLCSAVSLCNCDSLSACLLGACRLLVLLVLVDVGSFCLGSALAR